MESFFTSRTIYEKDMHAAVVTAFNQLIEYSVLKNH